MTREVVHLTADSPDLIRWLEGAEPLHRMLRPQMEAGYVSKMQRILGEGAHLALVHQSGVIRALAMFRAFHNTWNGYRFYIDDLVTDDSQRSAGHGRFLISWCEDLARGWGCTALTLESGVQRGAAHRFYFRERMTVEAFSFIKTITQP